MGCCSCYCSSHDDDDEVLEVTNTMKRQKKFGPLTEGRRCRDVFFFILFVLFCCGMAVVAWRVYHTGDPLRILYGTDSFGNTCGVDNRGITIQNSTGNPNVGLDLRNYTRLYYRNPEALDLSFTICVPDCPSQDIVCATNMAACEASGACYNTHPYSWNYTDTPNTNECPDVVYATTTLFGLSRCVPDLNNTVASDVISILSDITLLEQIVSDFMNSYYLFGYAAAVSVAVCFLVIGLMRCFVKPILYTAIILGLLGELALTVVTTYQWDLLKKKLDAEAAANETSLSQEVRNERLLFWLMIILWVFTAIVWLIALALQSRIRLSVTIFQKASKAIVRMPWIFLSPILTNVFVVGFFAYWVAVYVYMATSGDGAIVQGRIQWNDNTEYEYMWWYHLFGLFWIWQFILACQEFAIAGAVCIWFFSGKNATLKTPFWTSVGRLIRYHLGTAAFGSLIIAIVQMIRFLFEYVNNKLNNSKGNPIIDFLIKCFRCCLWCLEKFLRFINKNAYIEAAMYGYSFCTAARQAFNTLFKNILRVGVLNLVTAFALFVCKLFVIGGVGVLAYFYINSWDEHLDTNLHYWGFVVILCCLIAYIIADHFFAAVDMTVDTIFLCFAEDESNGDPATRDAYMDKGLQKFIKRHNTTMKKKSNKGGDDDEDEEKEYQLVDKK
eukprot:m.47682 g.47682  ORF g.47682 m.47682 type:complete len:668 (+) comp10783_c0_seq2:41-2044(+)